MEIRYNAVGAARKPLVNAIGEILNVKPKYLGAPSMAYQIGQLKITKEGTLVFDDDPDAQEVNDILERLTERGFRPVSASGAEDEKFTAERTDEPCGANFGLTVEVPIESVSVGNLTNLLSAKGYLIKKAFGITELPVEVKDNRIVFAWFDRQPEGDEVKAYTHLISALCEMSVKQKRISDTEKPSDNEKYAFRCFLLRLGFIGEQYKTERKILLKSLEGSAAFKTVKPS